MGQYHPALAAYRLLLRSLPVCFAFCRTGVVGGVVAPVVDLAVAMAEILTVGGGVAPVVCRLTIAPSNDPEPSDNVLDLLLPYLGHGMSSFVRFGVEFQRNFVKFHTKSDRYLKFRNRRRHRAVHDTTDCFSDARFGTGPQDGGEQGYSFHSIPFHSIPFHSLPFHSIPFHSIPCHY